MVTKIYGGSDDLIEIEGEIQDEVGCYATAEKGLKFSASDGTIGNIKYDGEWRIDVTEPGSLIKQHIKSVGDEANHVEENAKGCSSYSDVLVFDSGIEWIKIGNKKYSK